MYDIRSQARQGELRNSRQDRGRSGLFPQFPVVESGNVYAEPLSPRSSKYFSDLYPSEAMSESAESLRQYTVPSFTKPRTASVVTLFPCGIDSDRVLKDADVAQYKYAKDLNLAAQKGSFLRKHYRRLKDIHDNGPPGEAQMFMAGMNNYWKERKAIAELDTYSSRQKDGASPEPVSRYACQSRHPPQTDGSAHGNKPRRRTDSVVSYGNISRTSREVPVKIRRTVLEMEIDKPLPPIPPLDATPKQRLQNNKGRALNLNKPLPRTPLDCYSSPDKPVRKPIDESPVDAPWPSHTQTVGLAPSEYQPRDPQGKIHDRPQRAEQNPQRTWFNNLTSALPLPGKLQPSKAAQAHELLKAKISRPIPIPHTVNNYSPVPAPALSNKLNGKSKAPSTPTWLDRLAHPTMPTIPALPALSTLCKPKKRPASDGSFTCQGLRGSNVYAEIVMAGGALGVGGGRPVVGAGKDAVMIDDLLPEPLFTGRRSDGSLWDGSGAGLDRHATGRWI